MSEKVCPQCRGKVERVTQGEYSMLNSEQFYSIKAGDYLCPACLDNGRAENGGCYWWERELASVPAPAQEEAKAAAEIAHDKAEEWFREHQGRLYGEQLSVIILSAITTATASLRSEIETLRRERDETARKLAIYLDANDGAQRQ